MPPSNSTHTAETSHLRSRIWRNVLGSGSTRAENHASQLYSRTSRAFLRRDLRWKPTNRRLLTTSNTTKTPRRNTFYFPSALPFASHSLLCFLALSSASPPVCSHLARASKSYTAYLWSPPQAQ
jgi:hypothetical protein